MFGIESGTAVDYHELNAGAHRKPPKVLSAPSLVWHLAFWTNLPELDGHGKPLRNDCGGIKKKDPQEIREAVDHYILALYSAILKNEHVDKRRIDSGRANLDGEAHIHGHSPGVQLTPRILGAYLLFDSAYAEQSFASIPVASLLPRQKDIFESTTRTVALQFVWRQLDVSIRFEVRTECFTISTFVELDRGRVKARDRRRFSSIPDLDECIGSILNYLNGAPPPPQSTPGAPAPTVDSEQLAGSINKYCFHAFWKAYQAEVLSDDVVMSWAGDAVFQHIFADFRGIVVSDQAIRFPDAEFFGNSKPANWGSEAKKKFLPLIQHRDRSVHSRYECTVNYMLDGRALYMSTLGPQLLHPSMSEAERIPVEFIVYAHQRYNDTTIVNKWQLGRLVNQILLLGTFRLCALKDVKSLHHAGRQLSQLEQRTQAARDEIASTETSPGAGNPDGEQGETATPNDEAVMRLIGNAHETLNKITGDFLTTGSGLFYRIERSRYYVKQFDENVKLLRIGRLEGDQPYESIYPAAAGF
jgi:hypothetical protein